MSMIPSQQMQQPQHQQGSNGIMQMLQALIPFGMMQSGIDPQYAQLAQMLLGGQNGQANMFNPFAQQQAQNGDPGMGGGMPSPFGGQQRPQGPGQQGPQQQMGPQMQQPQMPMNPGGNVVPTQQMQPPQQPQQGGMQSGMFNPSMLANLFGGGGAAGGLGEAAAGSLDMLPYLAMMA